jgi:hypothetical protein
MRTRNHSPLHHGVYTVCRAHTFSEYSAAWLRKWQPVGLPEIDIAERTDPAGTLTVRAYLWP